MTVVDDEARREGMHRLDALEASVSGAEIALTDGATVALEGHFEIARHLKDDVVTARLIGRAPPEARWASSEFVGRHREVAMLQGLLEQAIDRRGRIVTIVGE